MNVSAKSNVWGKIWYGAYTRKLTVGKNIKSNQTVDLLKGPDFPFLMGPILRLHKNDYSSDPLSQKSEG